MQFFPHSNILRHGVFFTVLLWLCSSCIDEFTADLESTGDTFLVVEGSICSQTTCVFHLSRSLPLSPSAEEIIGRRITDAKVSVHGSDHMLYPAVQTSPGAYQIEVGQLVPLEKYWLEIEWEGNRYASDATTPLPTTEIVDLHFEQPREDKYVDILITPGMTEANKPQYFRWDYTEDWEIRTPYTSHWEYLQETDEIIEATHLTNQGWCKSVNHSPIIGTNSDYVNGEIRNYCIYSLNNLDDRFNWLYCTTIAQRAISREEYEYQRLLQRQSDEMGGLFTPQPSELPTNIHCQDEQRKAVGYVGVSLNAVSRRLFVSRNDVDYHLQRRPIEPSDEELAQYSRAELYAKQFRILEYDEMAGKISWIERWAVDCTSWGASFNRPEFWPAD